MKVGEFDLPGSSSCPWLRQDRYEVPRPSTAPKYRHFCLPYDAYVDDQGAPRLHRILISVCGQEVQAQGHP